MESLASGDAGLVDSVAGIKVATPRAAIEAESPTSVRLIATPLRKMIVDLILMPL